ncbi:hypothetical protein [Winogradskyella forsetii]|uniref:hypothetical protein n=1 Tax=Winogradskyella forsetii TaxID=2686077 RepID=UPI0015BB5F0D|nr:hypothetical protein [Winogradskyella forsetii]
MPTLKQLQRHKNNPKLCYIIEVIGTKIFTKVAYGVFLYFRRYNCYYVKYRLIQRSHPNIITIIVILIITILLQMKQIILFTLLILYSTNLFSQSKQCANANKQTVCLETNSELVSLSFNPINSNNKRVGFEFKNTTGSYYALYKYSLDAFRVKPKDGFMLQFENDHIIILYSKSKISFLLYQNNDLDAYYISPSLTKEQVNILFKSNNDALRI